MTQITKLLLLLLLGIVVAALAATSKTESTDSSKAVNPLLVQLERTTASTSHLDVPHYEHHGQTKTERKKPFVTRATRGAFQAEVLNDNSVSTLEAAILESANARAASSLHRRVDNYAGASSFTSSSWMAPSLTDASVDHKADAAGLFPDYNSRVSRRGLYTSRSEFDKDEATVPVTPATTPRTSYNFVVVPKQLIEFFEPTREGCRDHAKWLGTKLSVESGNHEIKVNCIYSGPRVAEDRGIMQALMVEEILFGGFVQVDGIAISVVDDELITPILLRAKKELDIPIVTFDSDAPESGRSYYIGTNNTFYGKQMARQVESLNPGGGFFGIISGESTNLQERADGIIQELKAQSSNSEFTWTQFEDSPFDAQNNMTLALEKLDEWASQDPQVLLSVTGLPMRIKEMEDGSVYAPWQDFSNDHRHRNITLLCADASPHQIKFFEYGYVDGLAGQLPYDMGVKSIATLFTLLNNRDAQLGDSEDGDFIGTNVLWFVRVPLRLPPLSVDMNRIGGLSFVGYTLFGVVAATSFAFVFWAFVRRNVRVVKVAQPKFLVMIAIGVLIMASCYMHVGTMACQHGIHITFSALYSKTYRVNKIFAGGTNFGRVKVNEKDVLIPFFVLVSINLSILLCWTFLDPLTYTREADHARDEWNRVISTYGVCTSDSIAYFLTPLLLVNFGVLAMAVWQAYRARDLEAEFSETKFIFIGMASLLQAMISGMPVLFFVKDIPQAFYMVFILFLFIISMVLLLVIFVPKMLYTHQFLQLSPQQQKKYMSQVILKSTKASFTNRPAVESPSYSPQLPLSDEADRESPPNLSTLKECSETARDDSMGPSMSSHTKSTLGSLHSVGDEGLVVVRRNTNRRSSATILSRLRRESKLTPYVDDEKSQDEDVHEDDNDDHDDDHHRFLDKDLNNNDSSDPTDRDHTLLRQISEVSELEQSAELAE